MSDSDADYGLDDSFSESSIDDRDSESGEESDNDASTPQPGPSGAANGWVMNALSVYEQLDLSEPNIGLGGAKWGLLL